jgi:uncharacterized repeat protein (TIGR01451 family)
LISALVLLVCFSSVSAQAPLKEPADKTDVGAAIKESRRSAQSENSIAATDPNQSRQLIRIIPFDMGSSNKLRTGLVPTAGAHLTYWGGPVISNLQVVVAFWGPNVVTTSAADGTATLNQFYADIVTSRYFDTLAEYTTAGIAGEDGVSTSNQIIGRGTFGGAFTIHPSVCPGGLTPCTITDTQVQTELTNQINSHALPAPQTDAHGIINTYYAIYFPPNVTIALTPTVQSCVTGGFCAYHSDTASLIPYGVVPDFSTGGCTLGCGLGTLFQRLTHASSHELAEAVTDAEVGSAGPFAPPLGWYDFPPNLGEIADVCDPLSAGITAGSNNYTVEPVFSNLQNDCVTSPPNFKITLPAQAGPGVAFNATLAVDGSASFVPISNYTDTVHFTSSDPLAVLPADFTFAAGDAGVHTFSFTLNTPGNQTITVADTRFSSFTGSTTINVNTAPDLTVAASHTADFVVGQTGAYTILVSNIGGGTTSGTVTATDTLPSGLAATAIGGTGWSCTLATLTCTRTDGLTANHSYPVIVLTVNVTATSPTSVSNTATVSGGNDGNPLNNTANDPTAIIAPIVDLRTAISANSSVIAGTNGFTYTVTVTNAGALPSTGEVIVNTSGPFSIVSISGTGWGTCSLAGQCIRTDSLAPGQSYPVITVTTNVSPIAPSLASLLAAVSGGGNSGTNTSTSFTVTVNSPVSIVSNSPGVTVTAGQPAQYTIGMEIGSAVGNVPFSCSGLPAASSCSFSPASLSASGNVVMTVTTTARSSAVRFPAPGNRTPLIFVALLSVAALILLGIYGQPRVARRLVPVLGTAALLAGMLAGCGGGGSGTPPIPTPTPANPAVGTPAGTYGITFTAKGPFGNVNRSMLLVVK